MTSRKQGTFEWQGQEHDYIVRKSGRAKHILLHVTGDGLVELVVPKRGTYREAEQFLRTRREWVVNALKRYAAQGSQSKRRSLTNGMNLSLFGDNYRLRIVVDGWRERSSYGEERDEISVYVKTNDEVREVLERWYKKRARAYFEPVVHAMAEQLNVRVNKLVISRARSQWGSCIKSTGRVSLNWRLALGPQTVADYVAAHEVAHLVEDNHSKRFWDTVKELDASYEEQRMWLRKQGNTLVL